MGEDQEPLAPFNNAEPFELAVLALLLSKGKTPAKHLPAAASLWAQAYQYREHLRDVFWGEEMMRKLRSGKLEILSFGASDEFVDLKTACAKYSWGEKHLRELLKENLPPHIFKKFWKPPIKKIQIPKTLLDSLDKIQARKRIERSRKAVKPQ